MPLSGRTISQYDWRAYLEIQKTLLHSCNPLTVVSDNVLFSPREFDASIISYDLGCEQSHKAIEKLKMLGRQKIAYDEDKT